MKVNVVKFEAEGEASELAEFALTALHGGSAAAGGHPQTRPMPETPALRGPAHVLEAAPSAPVVVDPPRHANESGVSDDAVAPEGSPVLVDDAARGGSTTSHPAPTITASSVVGEPYMPSGRFRDWQDIPAELLVWNSTGFCAHIAKRPGDPHDTWCGHSVGHLRATDLEPRADAEPCKRCNRYIEIEIRERAKAAERAAADTSD